MATKSHPLLSFQYMSSPGFSGDHNATTQNKATQPNLEVSKMRKKNIQPDIEPK